MDFLEELEDGQFNKEVIELPFFRILEKRKKDKELLLRWLNSVSGALIEESKMRSRVQKDNLRMYRGVSTRQYDRFIDRDRNVRRLNKVQRFVINHLHDLTETKISQMTRIKPAVEVLPTNGEWEDRASAKVSKAVINHLWYNNNIDFLLQQMQRHARIFGESYAFVLWDQDRGDLTEAYAMAKKTGNKELIKKVPLKHTGDVSYELELPWRVLLHRTTCIDDSEYLFRVKVEDTEKLKEKYPEKKKKIDSTDDIYIFDVEHIKEKHLEKHSLVFEFFHKNTKEVENGYYIKFTKDVILEERERGYLHGKLPIVRLTDLDVPEVLNGVSRYEQIVPLQKMLNNLNSLVAKSIYLGAHPKWVMPRGAAKIEQLGNDSTVVQFQGPMAPQLIASNPVSRDVLEYAQSVKEQMQVVYGSHGISRGEVPKGITAASALQFLNELESERASTDISKHGFLIKDMAKMTLAVAGEFYDTEDGRMVRIVGENNKFLIRHFDAAHLHKSYDIRLDNSTGLPETKSAKIQRILEAMQRNPQMLSGERWEELLELGDTEKLQTIITEAVKAADSENEDLLAGREIAQPEEWEDHVIHWQSHTQHMQSRQFKEEATPEVRKMFKKHVYDTEELIIEKIQQNPEFEAKVATLTLFPLFYHESYTSPARSLEQQMAMVQGQANRGDEVTGQIPGTDPAEAANAQRILKGGK